MPTHIALADGCGFAVPAIVMTPTELRTVYDDAMGMASPLGGDVLRRYVMFLKKDPPADAIGPIDRWSYEGERAKVVDRAVHIWLAKSTHEAKLSNTRFERTLGTGTTRDLNVVTKLVESWGS